jgi:hypothetical protein
MVPRGPWCTKILSKRSWIHVVPSICFVMGACKRHLVSCVPIIPSRLKPLADAYNLFIKPARAMAYVQPELVFLAGVARCRRHPCWPIHCFAQNSCWPHPPGQITLSPTPHRHYRHRSWITVDGTLKIAATTPACCSCQCSHGVAAGFTPSGRHHCSTAADVLK